MSTSFSSSDSRKCSESASLVLSVGLACYDHIVMVPSLQTVGEGARVTTVARMTGGVAATAAVAACRCGGRSVLWSRVGEDEYGTDVINGLASYGVETSGIDVQRGCLTAVSTILVEDGTGERRFLYRPGQFDESGVWNVSLEVCDIAGAVLVDGRWMDLCQAVVERARNAGIPTISDIGHASVEERDLLSRVDYPVLSELALSEYTSDDSGDDVAGELLQGGARAVIVTRGEQGGDLWTDGAKQRLPAFDVNVVDTTGAGDCFHGVFALRIAEGASAKEAAFFASAASALACTGLGGSSACPSRSAVEAFLAARLPEWRRD